MKQRNPRDMVLHAAKIVKISIWKKHLLISKQKEHEHLTCCHLRSFPFCEINLSNPMSNYGNFDVTKLL